MTDVKEIQNKKVLCEFGSSLTNVIGGTLSIAAALTPWITSGQTFMPSTVGGFDYKTVLGSMSLTQVCGPMKVAAGTYGCASVTGTVLTGAVACFLIGFIFGMFNGIKYILQGLNCSAFLCASKWCTYTQLTIALLATAFTLAGTCVAVGNAPTVFLDNVLPGMKSFWAPGFGLSIAGTVFQFMA